MKKYYKIAGLTVQMESFGRTVEQAAPYEIEPVEKADVVIENAPSEYINKYSYLSPSECEYIYTGMSFYKQLINFGGIMLHSSAVVVDGRAYLFTATSGTGKSTHTALYLKEFGDRAYILNDDKPAVRLEDGAFYAYGTPWSGKHDISANERVPIAGICVLGRGEKNEISPIGGKAAIYGIYSQTMHPKSEIYMDKVFATLEKLLELVPIYMLRCNMDPEAARISYAAMSNPKPKRGNYEA